MKVFCVHPSPLMYTKVFLRLEPLGLELVAESLRSAGHDIRLMDLQVESHDDFFRELDDATEQFVDEGRMGVACDAVPSG